MLPLPHGHAVLSAGYEQTACSCVLGGGEYPAGKETQILVGEKKEKRSFSLNCITRGNM